MVIKTLWERISDTGPPDPDDEIFNEKIPVHAFWGMISEWERGYETQANVLATFNISPGIQQQQAASIKQHINAAPDKTEFIRIVKDWSYTAESQDNPEAAKYRDWDDFEQRMSDIVTDQGGTPPP